MRTPSPVDLNPCPTSAGTNTFWVPKSPSIVPGLPPRISRAFPLKGHQAMGAPGIGAHACGVAVMLNGADVVFTPAAEACSVSPVPAALMDKPGNVAIPAVFVVWGRVPVRVPGPELRLSVIGR